jgi:uncharacterized protein (TIGR02246 family)
MKNRIFAAAIVLCLGLAAGNPLLAQEDAKSTVTAIEKSLWEAWKNKDSAPFQQHLADNTVSVSPHGVSSGKQQVIQQMSAEPCDVREFSFSDWQVHEISDSTLIVTYKAKQDATCGGTKIPADVVASSVYVKRDGKWLAASHQETPLMETQTRRAE